MYVNKIKNIKIKMVSYYDICVNDFDPALDYRMTEIMMRMEKRHKKDIERELNDNEKSIIKNCQKYINKQLELADINKMYGDKTIQLDGNKIGIICDFYEKNGENEDEILFRTLKIGNPFNILDYVESCKIHLFNGKGRTICGKESGDIAYLVGKKAYCRKCFETDKNS